MLKNPLLDKIRNGGTALGLRITSPEMVELCAYLGFDWFVIDQMFSSNDWGKTEDLIRAGEAAGITPVVRLQANPWLGYDARIAVDATRALAIGAQFLFVSNSCQKEIEDCLKVGSDWHRKAMTIHPFKNAEEWVSVNERQKEDTFIIPQPESLGAVDALYDMIRLPGVKAVLIAMTDLSRVITGQQKPDWYNPKLWEYVDKAVELGKEHGVVVGANTSYAYSMKEMGERVRILKQHGIRMIQVQSAPFLFQISVGEFLSDLRPVLDQA